MPEGATAVRAYAYDISYFSTGPAACRATFGYRAAREVIMKFKIGIALLGILDSALNDPRDGITT